MASKSSEMAGSIDDFLLGLADGIHKAQRQLAQVSIGLQPGQPSVTYQLPRVDFEFKVSFELNTSGDSEDGGAKLRLRPAGGPSASSSSEAASIIRGSFVAVPALGGKPPPVITTRLTRSSARTLQLEVTVATAAGERLADVPVEFNVDRELSLTLNRGSDVGLGADTQVWNALVKTDARGLATTVLEVSKEAVVGTIVAVLVDALSETQTITFRVDAGGT